MPASSPKKVVLISGSGGWVDRTKFVRELFDRRIELLCVQGEDAEEWESCMEWLCVMASVEEGIDHLVLTTAWAEPIALSGCYLFDFGAEAGSAPESVSAWLAERPAQTVDQSGMPAQIWNVETIDGVWDLQNRQVSAGSRAAMIVGYDGASIKLTSTVAAAPSGEGDANRTNPGN